MAGSFDSHFARHNMMWQCQLSQPDCRCYRVDGYSLLKRLPLHPLIGPRCPLQSVGQWLDSIGLVQYENHLLANGFDNVQFMVSVFSSVFFQEIWMHRLYGFSPLLVLVLVSVFALALFAPLSCFQCNLPVCHTSL